MLYVGMARMKDDVIAVEKLLTRPESFAKPSKHTSNSFWTHFQPYITPARSYLPSGLCARIRQHGVSRISVIISYFFSKPTISILERVDRLISLLNVSRVGGGMHGPQAIASFRLTSLRFHRGTRTVDRERRHFLSTQHAQWPAVSASRHASSREQTAS